MKVPLGQAMQTTSLLKATPRITCLTLSPMVEPGFADRSPLH